ncbi:MAG: hypothetical protein U0992_03620 [Planctomycetaceae bacterium]
MSARTILLTALTVTAIGHQALRAEDSGAMEVRVYPVADIVQSVPDYPFRPGLPTSDQGRIPESKSSSGTAGMGGMGGGGFFQIGDVSRLAVPSTSASEPDDLDTLINVIQTSIAPATWSNSGGGAAIVALGTSLIVRQTADVHKEIHALLQSLSQQSNRQTMVTIRAFLLSPKSAEETESWNTLLLERRKNAPQGGKVMAKLEHEAKDLGQITCFSGQQVHLADGNRRSFVSSAVPVVSAYSGAYQPVITTLHIGTLLEFTATVDPAGKSAMLDVRCTITGWNEGGEPIRFTTETHPGKVSARGGGGAGIGGGEVADDIEIGGGRSEAAVERVNLDAQQLATTVRVPVSIEGDAPYPVIVGTLGRPASAADPKGEKTGLSYLVISISGH